MYIYGCLMVPLDAICGTLVESLYDRKRKRTHTVSYICNQYIRNILTYLITALLMTTYLNLVTVKDLVIQLSLIN